MLNKNYEKINLKKTISIKTISEDDSIIQKTKDLFSEMSTSVAKNLIVLSLTQLEFGDGLADITTKQLGATKNFIKKNKKRLIPDALPGKENHDNHKLDSDFLVSYKKMLKEKIKQISIQSKVGGANNDKFVGIKKIDGDTVEFCDVHTIDTILKTMTKLGKNINFVYDFYETDNEGKKILKTPALLKNVKQIQVVNITLNNFGELYEHPIKYNYVCKECGMISSAGPSEVASTLDGINCPTMVETSDGKIKRCNKLLKPAKELTETKNFFVYSATYLNETGDSLRADVISEKSLPMGLQTTALVKIPNPYSGTSLFIVDCLKQEYNDMELLEQKKDEHNLFRLIRSVDKHIYNKTKYKHYGFIPMKISMLLMLGSNGIKSYENQFNMMIVGSKSTGKTTFNDYWGSVMYGTNMLSTAASTTSIAKMRGTRESTNLFGKKIEYVSRGFLGTKKFIFLDELKEKPELKDAFKSFLRKSTYEYVMQGSSGVTYDRTAQVSSCENINIEYLKTYRLKIKKHYESGLCELDKELLKAPYDKKEKPLWESEWDCEQPLFKIDNPYLRLSISKVRTYLQSTGINWIDGAESAADDRFVFFYYLDNKKSNANFTEVINNNIQNNAFGYNVIELSNKIFAPNLQKHIVELYDNVLEKIDKLKGDERIKYFKHETEYINLLNNSMLMYGIDNTPRTLIDFSKMLKLVRAIDGRVYFNQQDLDIVKYIMENIRNKVEMVDTEKDLNNFVVVGAPKIIIPKAIEASNMFNEYKNNF